MRSGMFAAAIAGLLLSTPAHASDFSGMAYFFIGAWLLLAVFLLPAIYLITRAFAPRHVFRWVFAAGCGLFFAPAIVPVLLPATLYILLSPERLTPFPFLSIIAVTLVVHALMKRRDERHASR